MRIYLWTAAATLAASACTGTLVLPSGSGGSTSTDPGTAGNVATTSYYDTTTYDTSTDYYTSTTYDTSTHDCQAWVDYPGIATQTIRFVNQTGQPIYLGTNCDGRLDFELTNANGPGDYRYTYDTSCLQTCQMLQTQAPSGCGACLPSSVRVPAGGSYDYVWDGTALENVLMDPACFAYPSSGPCPMKRTAPTGDYTAAAVAWPSCDTSGGCTCDAQGHCTGNPGGAYIQSTTPTFAFPSNGGPVEVDFLPIPDGG